MSKRRRLATASIVLGLVAGGLVPAATAGPPQRLTLRQVQERFNAIRRDPLPKHLSAVPGTHASRVTNATYYSYNWAGYVNSRHTFNRATAVFKVPVVTCTRESYMSLWVGLDGFSNTSVEQDGIAAYCAYNGAAPYYFAWWELYPQDWAQLVYEIRPGDTMTARVEYLGKNKYALAINDVTRHKYYTKYAYFTSGGYAARSSSEFIAEAPSGEVGQYDLAKFATGTFSHSTSRVGSTTRYLGHWYNSKIIMWYVHKSAEPGGIYGSGSSFHIYWRNYY